MSWRRDFEVRIFKDILCKRGFLCQVQLHNLLLEMIICIYRTSAVFENPRLKILCRFRLFRGMYCPRQLCKISDDRIHSDIHSWVCKSVKYSQIYEYTRFQFIYFSIQIFLYMCKILYTNIFRYLFALNVTLCPRTPWVAFRVAFYANFFSLEMLRGKWHWG